MSGLFLTVLVIAALLLTLYNLRQVSVLRARVSDLEAQLAELGSGKQSGAGSSAGLKLAEEARRHVERAMKYVTAGNPRAAGEELRKSLEKLEKLPRPTGAPARAILEDVQEKLDQTSRALEKIWGAEPKPGENRGGRSR